MLLEPYGPKQFALRQKRNPTEISQVYHGGATICYVMLWPLSVVLVKERMLY